MVRKLPLSTSIIALAALSLVLAAPPALASQTAAPAGSELKVNHPVSGGHWDQSTCAPSNGSPLPVPLIAMAHLTHFKIAKPSRVTLSVTVTQPGLNAQYQRTVSLGRIPSRSTKSDRSVEQIVFNHLGTPATLNPTAAKHTDRLTVDLPPGTYGTSTYYGYCAGRFRIALDSVKPLRITNQTLRLSTSKVSKDSLAGVLDLNTVVLRGSQAGKLTWRSTNPSIAKVNQRGLLTMRRWGKAKIVVTTSKGKTAMLTVTANKPPVG